VPPAADPPSPAPAAGATRARAVRGLALAARSLEQAAGDLTLAQYRVLAFVAAGTERSSLVAEGLALAKPTVTAAVDGLVERKLVTREAVAGDRRSLRLAVTPAGEAALRAAETSMAERLDRVLEHARDPEALVAALCDLDDALAHRLQARLRARVRS
jgi:DNA-binding MarR family transcriptional regulator